MFNEFILVILHSDTIKILRKEEFFKVFLKCICSSTLQNEHLLHYTNSRHLAIWEFINTGNEEVNKYE